MQLVLLHVFSGGVGGHLVKTGAQKVDVVLNFVYTKLPCDDLHNIQGKEPGGIAAHSSNQKCSTLILVAYIPSSVCNITYFVGRIRSSDVSTCTMLK